MATYKTPGVYVEEISTFPPSVAPVSTAIPAFIGYTAIGPTPDDSGKVEPVVARINTLLEYETLFGAAPGSKFSVSTRSVNGVTEIETITREDPQYEFLMYYSLSLYFKNGGGSCFVVSVGDYTALSQKGDFEAGLAALKKEDEPTLILLTDASGLLVEDYYDLCQQSLAQCNELGDRFAILDVLNGDVEKFRDKIGTANLKYGAAYHPYLNTTLSYRYREGDVNVIPETAVSSWKKVFGDQGIQVKYKGAPEDMPQVKITTGSGDGNQEVTFTITDSKQFTIGSVSNKSGADVVSAWEAWTSGGGEPVGFEVIQVGEGSGEVPNTSGNFVDLELIEAVTDDTMATIKSSNTSLYNQLKTALSQQRVILPPSPAVAGRYATVDRERGVWKAPANVSLSAVIGPVIKITHAEQEDLNVDPTAGKSINAIRAFSGKGTLIWGARTLAGNDNEWRYVPVRRLFNMIEESTQKSTAFAVFEPNDATTWLKVKAMIEAYLYGLWEQGALAGATMEAAYFINVGLGKTMTEQDVLEGRMIVEIGVAAVRPAEFIIIRFSHKLQEA